MHSLVWRVQHIHVSCSSSSNISFARSPSANHVVPWICCILVYHSNYIKSQEPKLLDFLYKVENDETYLLRWLYNQMAHFKTIESSGCKIQGVCNELVTPIVWTAAACVSPGSNSFSSLTKADSVLSFCVLILHLLCQQISKASNNKTAVSQRNEQDVSDEDEEVDEVVYGVDEDSESNSDSDN